MVDATKIPHSAEKIGEAELSVIASDINAREAEINAMVGKSLHLAALIGRDLNQVKGNLPLGQFMPWVKNNCSLNHHHINRYQRLARECPEYLDPEKCPVMSINVALELLSAPDDVKSLVLEAVAAGEPVRQRDVRELCDKPAYPDNRQAVKPEIRLVEPINTAPRPETWQFVPHSCVVCMGRLLMRRVSPKITEYICSECENRVRADEPPCWCHKTIGNPASGGFDGNVLPTRKHQEKIFECIVNPDRSIVTNAIIIKERPYSPMQGQRQLRPAFTDNAMDYL